MNYKKTVFILTAFALLIIASCKTKKTTSVKEPAKTINTDNTVKANLVNSINLNKNDFSYYSCNGTLKYKDPDQKVSVDVVMNMEKDKYLFLSATALFINVARVLATPDSLVILDLIHRKAIVSDYHYIKKMTGVPLTFTQLQNLIIGNAPFNHDLQTTITDTILQQIHITDVLNATQAQTVSYNAKSLKAQQTKVIERNAGKEFTIQYAEPFMQQANAFPSIMNINIQAEKNIECNFELKNFAFDKKKELVFSIPKTFEVVRY